MTTLATLVIGDTFDNSATLYAGSPSAAYDVSTATEIKATVTNSDGSEKYCSDVTLSSGAAGADWASGVIVYAFTPTITAEIADHVTEPEIARLETQVTISGNKYTWTAPINIRPGNIA